MLTAILLGAAAASGLPLGAVLAGRMQAGHPGVGIAAAFSAGTLIGAAAFDLLQRAGQLAGPALAVGGLLSGAVILSMADGLAYRVLGSQQRQLRLAVSIVAGAVLDGVPESVALGLHGTRNLPLALWIAVFLSNVPEGVVASTALAASGYTRGAVLRMWGTVIGAMGACAGAGYALGTRLQAPTEGALLALAAGGILAMVTMSLIPAATRTGRGRAALAAALGLAAAYLLAGGA